MVQPLLRRRIHRGLVSISPCGTAGAGLRRSRRAGEMHTHSFRAEARAMGDCRCSPLRRHGSATQRGPRKRLRRRAWLGCNLTTFGPAGHATSGRNARSLTPAAAMTIRKRHELFGNGQLVRFGGGSVHSLCLSFRTSFPLIAYAVSDNAALFFLKRRHAPRI